VIPWLSECLSSGTLARRAQELRSDNYVTRTPNTANAVMWIGHPPQPFDIVSSNGLVLPAKASRPLPQTSALCTEAGYSA
jgi:hypothetical protein